MLPNELEGKIGDVDQTEAYFIFCKEKDLTPQKISSQEQWQKIGPKSRAAYRVKAGFQGVWHCFEKKVLVLIYSNENKSTSRSDRTNI